MRCDAVVCLLCSGDVFTVNVKDSNENLTPVKPRDLGDGTYSVVLGIMKGDATIDILHHSVPVQVCGKRQSVITAV